MICRRLLEYCNPPEGERDRLAHGKHLAGMGLRPYPHLSGGNFVHDMGTAVDAFSNYPSGRLFLAPLLRHLSCKQIVCADEIGDELGPGLFVDLLGSAGRLCTVKFANVREKTRIGTL